MNDEDYGYLLPTPWRLSMDQYYWPEGKVDDSLVRRIWLARKQVSEGALSVCGENLLSMAGMFFLIDIQYMCDMLEEPDFEPESSMYDFMCMQRFDNMFDGDMGHLVMRMLLVLKRLTPAQDATLQRVCRRALAELAETCLIDDAYLQRIGLLTIDLIPEDEDEVLFDTETAAREVAETIAHVDALAA